MILCNPITIITSGTYTDTLTFEVEVMADDVSGEEDAKLTCSRCGKQVDEADICDDITGNVCFDCCGHWFYCDTCANTFHDITGPHQHGFIMPPCDECGSPTSEDELCSNGLCEDCCRMTCDGMCENSWNEEPGDDH